MSGGVLDLTDSIDSLVPARFLFLRQSRYVGAFRTKHYPPEHRLSSLVEMNFADFVLQLTIRGRDESKFASCEHDSKTPVCISRQKLA